jgi:hypothetical protein
VRDSQTIATFDFGERLGILDFADEQYFSWIRGPRFLVRGERGEIHGLDVRWLADAVHDRYLDLLVEASIRSGEPVRAEGHIWDIA